MTLQLLQSLLFDDSGFLYTVGDSADFDPRRIRSQLHSSRFLTVYAWRPLRWEWSMYSAWYPLQPLRVPLGRLRPILLHAVYQMASDVPLPLLCESFTQARLGSPNTSAKRLRSIASPIMFPDWATSFVKISRETSSHLWCSAALYLFLSFVAPPEFGDFIPKTVVPGRVRNTSIPNLPPILVLSH